MLQVNQLVSGYGQSMVIRELSLTAAPVESLSCFPISSSRSRLRATRTMLWPSRAKVFASSWPMPLDAPVMRTLPRGGVTAFGGRTAEPLTLIYLCGRTSANICL